MRKLLVPMALLLIAGCSGDSDQDFEFVSMGGLNDYAMVVPKDMPESKIAELAKAKCGDQAFCSVFGWHNRVDMARAFPMTDREVKTLLFKYGLNRNSGFEEMLWNCDVFKGKKPEQCLAN